MKKNINWHFDIEDEEDIQHMAEQYRMKEISDELEESFMMQIDLGGDLELKYLISKIHEINYNPYFF